MRYTRETIAAQNANLQTQRLLGIFEAKYYFKAIEQLNGARFSLGIGLGMGQSQTSIIGATSSGTAALLPSTKLTLNYPLKESTDFLIETAYESLNIKEKKL